MSEYRGLFVTIEGPNGVGKSTLVAGVKSKLQAFNFDVYETSEPTASSLGHLVREIEEEYEGRTYACLVAGDRYHHLDAEIIPALQKGKVVLSARYVESSLVLQRLDGVDVEFIWSLNSQVLIPDLSVVLTAPGEILEKRLAERQSRGRFERTMSRILELRYYQEAAEFLSSHGFNVLMLDNGVTPLEDNVIRISEEITDLWRKRSHRRASE